MDALLEQQGGGLGVRVLSQVFRQIVLPVALPGIIAASIFSLIDVKLRMSVNRIVTVSVSPPSATRPLSRCVSTDSVMYLPNVVRRRSRSISPSTI